MWCFGHYDQHPYRHAIKVVSRFAVVYRNVHAPDRLLSNRYVHGHRHRDVLAPCGFRYVRS